MATKKKTKSKRRSTKGTTYRKLTPEQKKAHVKAYRASERGDKYLAKHKLGYSHIYVWEGLMDAGKL